MCEVAGTSVLYSYSYGYINIHVQALYSYSYGYINIHVQAVSQHNHQIIKVHALLAVQYAWCFSTACLEQLRYSAQRDYFKQ